MILDLGKFRRHQGGNFVFLITKIMAGEDNFLRFDPFDYSLYVPIIPVGEEHQQEADALKIPIPKAEKISKIYLDNGVHLNYYSFANCEDKSAW